jgi:hypothetical protein
VATTLQTYITQCQRLLHDASANFWSVSELTDYVNQARSRVAADTGCSRCLQSIVLNVQTCTGVGSGTGTITGVTPAPDQTWIGSSIMGAGLTGIVSSNPIVQTVTGTTITISGTATVGAVTFTYYQEAYPFTSVPTPTGTSIIDIANITAIWGNTRYALQYKEWSMYNAQMRSYVAFQQRPVMYSVFGQNTVFIGPIVDQPYVTEWDCVINPAPLVQLTDVENITYPYTDPVPYYACYLAKVKDSSWDEAKVFQEEYFNKIKHAIAASAMRRIPNIYAGM